MKTARALPWWEVLERYLQADCSLDAPVGDTGESWGDRLESDEPGPASSFARAESAAAVRSSVEALPTRLSKIIRLRFGLDDDDPLTLEQIASELNLSRERIRQLEREALGILRTQLAVAA